MCSYYVHFVTDYTQQSCHYPSTNCNYNTPQTTPATTSLHLNDGNYATPVQPVYLPHGYQIPAIYPAYPADGECYHHPHSANNVYINKPNQQVMNVGFMVQPQLPIFTTTYSQSVAPKNVTVVTSPVIYSTDSSNVQTHINAKVENRQKISEYKRIDDRQVSVQSPDLAALNISVPNNMQVDNNWQQEQNERHDSQDVGICPSNGVHLLPTAEPEKSPADLGIQNGVEASVPPPNKSWASLFNKRKVEAQGAAKSDVVLNGCSKPVVAVSPMVSAATGSECSEDFSAMKKSLRAKYDDPHFYRIGGKCSTV